MQGNFKQEFKRQIRLAMAAAIGFIIAFAWRDYIMAVTMNIFGTLTTTMPNASKLFSALLLTFIGVIFLFISSKILK